MPSALLSSQSPSHRPSVSASMLFKMQRFIWIQNNIERTPMASSLELRLLLFEASTRIVVSREPFLRLEVLLVFHVSYKVINCTMSPLLLLALGDANGRRERRPTYGAGNFLNTIATNRAAEKNCSTEMQLQFFASFLLDASYLFM